MDKQRLGSDPLSWIKPTKGGEPKKKVGRPKTIKREITKSSQEGLREGWTRATFIMKEATVEKIKDVAYWDRKQVKEVINEAIEFYLKDKKVKARRA